MSDKLEENAEVPGDDRRAHSGTVPQLAAGGPSMSEAEIQLLFDVIQKAQLTIWAADNADADYAIRLWTRGAERVYGFDRAEALGRNYLALFVNPSEHAEALESHRRIVETRQEYGWNSASHDVSKDGRIHTILSNSFPIWDGQRGRYLCAEVGIDITDFDRLDQQVRQLALLRGDARRQLKIVRGVQVLNEAIASLGLPDEGGLERVVRAVCDGLRIMLSSHLLCRVWLFDDAETPRLAPGSDVLPATPRIAEATILADLLHAQTDITFFANGGPLLEHDQDVYRSVIAAQLEFGGDVRAVLLMFLRRATTPREDELELTRHFSSHVAVALEMATLAREQQRRRYEDAEHVRHVIIESVMHTVGNEAGVAKLAADSLSSALESSSALTPSALRDLRLIQSSVDRLGKIMGELLNLSVRVEQKSRIRLDDAIRVVTRTFERDYYERVIIQYQIEPNLWVEASEYLLREAVGNLVRNAVLAMIDADGGGELRLSAKIVEREWNGRLRHVVRLDVEDSGPGIQPDYRDRIWESGFTTRGEGHGFGLYYTRGLVSMLGGAVDLAETASELGGAHFRIFLVAIPAD